MNKELYLIGSVDSGMITDNSEIASAMRDKHKVKVNKLRTIDNITFMEGRHIKVNKYSMEIVRDTKCYFSDKWTGLQVDADAHMGFVKIPISNETYKQNKEDIDRCILEAFSYLRLHKDDPKIKSFKDKNLFVKVAVTKFLVDNKIKFSKEEKYG